jgi:Tfp pilus assembly protein PilN
MINLLPQTQKEKLKEEKEKRIFFHWLILILFFNLSLSLSLLNLKIFLSEQTQKEKLDLENQEKILKLEAKKEILETNKLISELLNFEKNQKETSQILNKIFQILPPEIQVNSVNITKTVLDKKTKKEGFQIILNGFSPERQSLLKLKSILEDNFSQVSFPPQVWVKEKEIDFSVNFLTKE